MSDPFIAEIRIFAGNFAPRGWAMCDGQLLPIAQNTALFSLIGTTYGGDGRTTTALPNLRDRAPMHPGTGPGLTQRRLGQNVATPSVTLNSNTVPAHRHSLMSHTVLATLKEPATQRCLSRSRNGATYQSDASADLVAMAADASSTVGSGGAHNNLQPFLAVNFIVALMGVYPSRA